jgi:hypothetical protein
MMRERETILNVLLGWGHRSCVSRKKLLVLSFEELLTNDCVVDLSSFKEFEKRQKASLQKAKKNGAVGVENLAIAGSDGK